MANNYLQFSFIIPDLTFDETAWVREILSIDPDDEDDYDVRGLGQFAEEYPSYFGATIALDPDGLWIYADESGDPEHAANFVQAFLAKHRPEAKVGFTWATTCSKPRVDEFSGGGVVVSAADQKWINADQWVYEQMKS